jgi:hypothetical protein
MAGTVPATVPPDIWARTGHADQAQPAASVPRISGIATFTWIGDDPQVQTPHVTLQFETAPGTFTDVVRKSGRVVEDEDIVIAYTPQPLQRSGPQTHYWNVEWQAVPWFGSPAHDSLDERGAVPLGNYRFHVDGHSWSLDSAPFAVVEGGVSPTASRSTTVDVHVRWSAPKGWRLMDMAMMSNQPVPVRSASVKVELLDAGNGVVGTTNTTTDASGDVSVTNVGTATQVRVTDAFGNIGTSAIN